MLRVSAALLASVLLSLPSDAVTLVSKADPARPSGTAGGTSRAAGVSADGRYAVFLSKAVNLLAGVTDANDGLDVYLHDRVAGTTVLVSHAAGDPLATGDDVSDLPSISADGRWVAYLSRAGNLAAGQVEPEASWDVFLYDRVTGANTLASHVHGSASTAAGGVQDLAEISADGGRIAYVSWAADLAAGQIDEPGSPDVFLYDRAANASTLVSHQAGSAVTGTGFAFQVALSADGEWVAFGSEGAGMIPGEIDSGLYQIYLYGRATGTVALVSHVAGAAVAEGDDGSYEPRISADGSRVAFLSYATNLVAGQNQTVYGFNAYLYDRAAGTNALVSHAASSAAATGNGDTSFLALSADGRWVAFSSQASNLVAGDSGGQEDVFLYDRTTGANVLASRGSASANDRSWDPRVSADGSFVVFQSKATNLATGQSDRPGTPDLFLWIRSPKTLTLLTHADGSPAAAATGSPEPYPADDFRISAGGGWIVLTSLATGLVSSVEDANSAEDVFLHERATGENTLVTARSGPASATAGSAVSWWTMRALSNDGRYLAFNSPAPNLVPGLADDDNTSDVFLYDRIADASIQVSQGDAEAYGPLIAADGGALLFLSRSDPIAPPDLLLYDRPSGATTLVGHAILDKAEYAVSRGGRWVAFASLAADVVPGQIDTNGNADVFLWDRSTGESVLVSHAGSSPVQAGDGRSWKPGISSDGRWVVFRSGSTDLVPGQTGGGLFLYDRIAGTTTRFAVAAADDPTISADGRWVAFVSYRHDVFPGLVDNNIEGDVFLWDRVSGTTVLASHSFSSPVTTGNRLSYFNGVYSGLPVLSADGRWLVFNSNATDLDGGTSGIFLFDRIGGAVTRVGPGDRASLSADGRFVGIRFYTGDFLYDRIQGTTLLLAPALYDWPQLSADGAWVAFESPSPDLVPADLDGREDLFLHANPQGGDFYTVTPCRLLDTRQSGPALASGVERIVTVAGSCGVPATARSVVINVTVVQPGGTGRLTFYPGDLADPLTSTINFQTGQTRANNAMLSLALDGTGTLALAPVVYGGGTVHLILDVSGYFQ